jgi:hypothetical protein
MGGGIPKGFCVTLGVSLHRELAETGVAWDHHSNYLAAVGGWDSGSKSHSCSHSASTASGLQ